MALSAEVITPLVASSKSFIALFISDTVAFESFKIPSALFIASCNAFLESGVSFPFSKVSFALSIAVCNPLLSGVKALELFSIALTASSTSCWVAFGLLNTFWPAANASSYFFALSGVIPAVSFLLFNNSSNWDLFTLAIPNSNLLIPVALLLINEEVKLGLLILAEDIELPFIFKVPYISLAITLAFSDVLLLFHIDISWVLLDEPKLIEPVEDWKTP